MCDLYNNVWLLSKKDALTDARTKLKKQQPILGGPIMVLLQHGRIKEKEDVRRMYEWFGIDEFD